MKRFSIEARELLSAEELYNIKAGDGDNKPINPDIETCGLFCTNCVLCITCTSCNTKAMDVIILP